MYRKPTEHTPRRICLIPVILAFCLLAGFLTAFSESLPDAPGPSALPGGVTSEEIPTDELLKASSVDESAQLMYLELEDHIEVLQYIGHSLEVEIPETIAGKPVTHISLERFAQERAGEYFAGIRTVVLLETVIKLTRYAFAGLESLEEIRGLEYVRELGSSLFLWCGMPEAVFPSAVTMDFDPFSWSYFGKVTVRDDLKVRNNMFGFNYIEAFSLIRGDGEPTLMLSEDGCSLLTADGKRLLRVLPNFHGVCYTIPDGVEIIDHDIFWNLTELQEVVFPDSVNDIRQYNPFSSSREYIVAANKGSYAWDVMSEQNSGKWRMRDLSTEEKLSDMVARVVSEVVRPGMSEWEKAFALHNWVCGQMEYDRSETYYDAESVFTRGTGTCDAYARGYSALLDEADIENRWIACQLDGDLHAINAVRIDGEWCYVDCTNDDGNTIGAPYYLFGFNKVLYSNVYLGGTGIEAVSEKNYAPLVLGDLKAKEEVLVSAIQAHLDAGETHFSVSLNEEPFLGELFVGRLDGLMLSSVMASRAWRFDEKEAVILCDYSRNRMQVSLVSAGGSGFLYKHVEGGLCLTDYLGSQERVEIPSRINGQPVLALEGTFQANLTLKEAVLPEGLLEIGNNTFSSCTHLERVNYPSTLRRIGNAAFYYCEALTTDPILPENVREIGGSAFAYCSSIQKAVIPGWVKEPGTEAFLHCSNLSRVTLKNGVRVLTEGVFAQCTSLASLTLPPSLEAIVSGALTLTGITSVHIPANVWLIEPGAFLATQYLKELTVAEDNAEYSAIGNMLLSKDGKTLVMGTRGVDPDLITPPGVEVIGDEAFWDIPLDSVTISDGVRIIGASAFGGWNSYTSVTMADSVEEIRENAFTATLPAQNRYYMQQYSNFNHLQTIRLSRNLKIIGERAFYATKLKKLELPDSMTDITCSIVNTALEIHFPATIRTIADQVFGGYTGTFDRYAIYGYAGTAAETYAAEHGIPFFDEGTQITFDLKEIQLFPDECLTLKAWFDGVELDASEISWSIEGSCAVVENDTLRAVEAGWGTLTAAWNGHTGSCSVAVLYAPDGLHKVSIELNGIYTDSGYAVLIPGKIYDFKLMALQPEKPGEYGDKGIYMTEHVSWAVGDSSILRIRGLSMLEVVGDGKTVLTATLPDGQTVSADITAIFSAPQHKAEIVPVEELGEDPYQTPVIAVYPAAIENLIASGSFMPLVTPGRAEGGEVQYALGISAENAPASGWNTAVPTASACGTWYVWYQVIGDEGYCDVYARCIPVTISPSPHAIECEVSWGGMLIVQQQTADAETDPFAVDLILSMEPGFIPSSLTVKYLNSAGQEVTLIPEWQEGFRYSFPMPSADIRVTASFRRIAPSEAVLKLPAALQTISESAFEGTKAASVFLPDGCRVIEARAFRDCAELNWIRIPDSVESIDPTAFDGCARVYVIGRADSEAERFCAGKNHCIFIEQAEE